MGSECAQELVSGGVGPAFLRGVPYLTAERRRVKIESEGSERLSQGAELQEHGDCDGGGGVKIETREVEEGWGQKGGRK